VSEISKKYIEQREHREDIFLVISYVFVYVSSVYTFGLIMSIYKKIHTANEKKPPRIHRVYIVDRWSIYILKTRTEDTKKYT
jgi:glycerol-3-phosphate responsive antiterminator